MYFCTFLFSEEEDTFRNSPYLSTAMRLSVPGIGREPSEEEIMKDVANLEPLKFGPTKGLQNSVDPIWSFKRLSFDNVRDALKNGPSTAQRTKRYHEFLGKRDGDFQTGSLIENEAAKRWSDFVGKRGEGWVVSPTLVSKRYLEFIGKREPFLYRVPEKKYAEFLG